MADGTGEVRIDGIVYPIAGAQVAIRHEGRILIQFRPLPPGWELPGGHVDAGESPADAAVREAAEETGLAVDIVGLVGVYTWTGLRAASDAVFLAELRGGRPKRTLEAWAHRYVTADTAPRTLFPWTHQRIDDALHFTASTPPVVRVQEIGPLHAALFGLRWLRAPLDAIVRRQTPPR